MIEMKSRACASACLLMLAIGACAPTAGKSEPAQTSVATDSLVLERTVCFGFCPAYRLRINSAEQIRFESRNRGDSSSVAFDTAPRGTFASLISRARAAGFYELPPEIRKDPVLCHNFATDHPSAITTIFSSQSTRQVIDYHGCFETVEHEVLAPIQKLRAFENEIDSTLRSSRWVRPNRPAK
jgi:hypothetical protein